MHKGLAGVVVCRHQNNGLRSSFVFKSSVRLQCPENVQALLLQVNYSTTIDDTSTSK